MAKDGVGPKNYLAVMIATFALQRGYTPEEADMIMDTFIVAKIVDKPSEAMQILINITTGLHIEPEDEWDLARRPQTQICGAQNPRTGMICNVPPHPMRKHWTITEDGQRYDWYMEV